MIIIMAFLHVYPRFSNVKYEINMTKSKLSVWIELLVIPAQEEEEEEEIDWMVL